MKNYILAIIFISTLLAPSSTYHDAGLSMNVPVQLSDN